MRHVVESLEARVLRSVSNSFTFNHGRPIIYPQTDGPPLLVPFGDGGIFLYRNLTLTRLLPSGLADKRFHGGGISFGSSNNLNRPVELVGLQDGGVLVERYLDFQNANDFALQRFTRTGRLDRTFGDNGLLREHNLQAEVPLQGSGTLAVETDGSVLWSIPPDDLEIENGFICHIPADGNEEKITFGEDSLGTEILPSPDGSFFEIGDGVRHYNANLKLDKTYGANGVAQYRGLDFAGLTANGEVTTFFTSITANDEHAYLSRLLPNGQFDTSFGQGGTAQVSADVARIEQSQMQFIFRSDGSTLIAGESFSDDVNVSGPAEIFEIDRNGREIAGGFGDGKSDDLPTDPYLIAGDDLALAPGPDDGVYALSRVLRSEHIRQDILESLTSV